MFFKKKQERPSIQELNQTMDKRWLKKISIPKDQYVLVFDDMDIGAIMGGGPEPPNRIVPTFQEARKIIKETTDEDLRISVFDSNHNLVFISYEYEAR